MAWTQTDLDKLKRALAQGATKVRFADHEVSYRSLDEMRETMRIIQAEIDREAGVAPRRRLRQIRFVTGKGLCR